MKSVCNFDSTYEIFLRSNKSLHLCNIYILGLSTANQNLPELTDLTPLKPRLTRLEQPVVDNESPTA